MSLADELFIAMCRDILENGTSTEGEKVRPHWEDGTKAYGNPTLRIIDFDIVENSGSKGIDTPPTVAKDEEELPF